MADTEIDVDNSIDIAGLDKIGLKLDLPQPFSTTNTSTLDLQPLEIKPLEADLGMTFHGTVDPLKAAKNKNYLRDGSNILQEFPWREGRSR